MFLKISNNLIIIDYAKLSVKKIVFNTSYTNITKKKKSRNISKCEPRVLVKQYVIIGFLKETVNVNKILHLKIKFWDSLIRILFFSIKIQNVFIDILCLYVFENTLCTNLPNQYNKMFTK